MPIKFQRKESAHFFVGELIGISIISCSSTIAIRVGRIAREP